MRTLNKLLKDLCFYETSIAQHSGILGAIFKTNCSSRRIFCPLRKCELSLPTGWETTYLLLESFRLKSWKNALLVIVGL